MRSVNLSKLCMEENDSALKQEVRCNHGYVVHLKTSWLGLQEIPEEDIGHVLIMGVQNLAIFSVLRDKEDIDPRSKFMIPKLIEKLGDLENLVEASQYIEKYGSEEVDKPRESKEDDNCEDMKLEKLEEKIEKMKEREKKFRSNIAKRRPRENVLFFIVFCCCVVVIAIIYLFWMIHMKKGSMKLP